MFYDREKERADIKNILTSSMAGKKTILFLVAYSGVGKTMLIDELFSTTLRNIPHVHIHTSKHAVNTIEPGHYISRLYTELCKQATNKSGKKDAELKKFSVKQKLQKLLRFIFRWGLSRLNVPEGDLPLNSREDSSLLQKRDYIIEYLKRKPHIVAIENIQNIDAQSLDILQDIIRKDSQTAFVFEYTLDDDIGDSALYEEFLRTEVTVQRYFLNQLNESDALRLSPVKLENEKERQRVLELYHEKRGNLYQIILYNNRAEKEKNSIRSKINMLIEDIGYMNHLFLVYLVHLNGGNIDSQTLKDLATSPSCINQGRCLSEQEFNKAIHDLVFSQHIFTKNSGRLLIHDSIQEELNQETANPVLYSAYARLVDYYSTWRPSDVQQSLYRLLHLFFLYLRFCDERLLTILPDIRKTVIACKYPQAIYDALQRFTDLLSQKTYINERLCREVYKLLIEINIETNNAQNAWEFYNKMPCLAGKEDRILRARIYELGMSQEEIDAISHLIEESPENSHERLLLELSRIHIAMRIWSQARTAHLIECVVNNNAYIQYPEYAFALCDQAELLDSAQEAVSLYQSAIEILRQCGKTEFIGHLYTNICMSYAYMGKLDEAGRALFEAATYGIDEPVYLNNSAALDILRNCTTRETSEKLQDALLLHMNRFEQLIVHNNLLIALTILEDWEFAEKEFQYIKNSGFEVFHYAEFLHMNYQNLLYYCQCRRKDTDAQEYKAQLQALIDTPDTNEGTKRIIQVMLKQEKDSTIFYSNYLYRAEFLCNWGIPLAMR